MGYTLIIADGTLIYITLMHILPEVFLSDDEDHDHFGNDDDHEDHDHDHFSNDDDHDHDHFSNDDEEEKEKLLASSEPNNAAETKQIKETLLEKNSDLSKENHDHSHSHEHKASGGDRFCKLIILLAGLYSAELLRFV